MKRAWLLIALMLSLGVNVGVIFTIAKHRRAVERWAAPRQLEAEQQPPARFPAEPGLRTEPDDRSEPGRRIGPEDRSEAGRQGETRDRRPAERPAQPPRLDLLADRLRLRGEARDRFLEAQRKFFTEVTARRLELATLRRELRRELTSAAPDRERIDRILERTGRATAELDGAFADNVLAVRRILGPRQQRAYFRFLNRLRNGQR